ncbi:hypothetical protein [Streptomyces sp. PSAA01]|uniref:hypothetical protein n=1 Tax=Streptomyces sp. PSAA01 TaxID=2912762 RepID=UPI001F3D1B02|nr:hypothetical protein [Streptomyces sp. PSAA01]MCG0284545.1 hypothetical protein [Streptomyces sp. PSAA01]
MGRIDVVGPQRAQLLAPQRGVVGESEHHTVADRLAPGHLQYSQPLLFAGDPRQLRQPRHQAALATADPAAWGVATPAHRVRLAQTLFHEEVIEQPDWATGTVTSALIGRYRPTGVPRLGSKEDRAEAYRRLLDASTRSFNYAYQFAHLKREVGRAAHKLLLGQIPQTWEISSHLIRALHGVHPVSPGAASPSPVSPVPLADAPRAA